MQMHVTSEEMKRFYTKSDLIDIISSHVKYLRILTGESIKVNTFQVTTEYLIETIIELDKKAASITGEKQCFIQ